MRYQINECLVSNFEEKVRKFQRKFGENSITYFKSEPYYEIKCNDYGARYYVKVVDVDVEGSYQIKGYEFVASLEWIEEVGKNLIKKAPGTEEIPSIYLTRSECDHCKVERFRKYTVLLKNTETGEYVQVGKGCLKEYLGVDIESSASWFAIWDNLGEYVENLNKSYSPNPFNTYYSVDDILEQTVAQKNKEGYVSKAMIDSWINKHCDPEADYFPECPLTSTSLIVKCILTEEKDFKTGELIKPRYEITDDIKEEVAKVKEFILNAEANDYMNNLKILIEMEKVPRKEIGLVASMVGCYIRELKKLEAQNKPEAEKSDYVGNVGDKITVAAKLECIFSADSQYGMVYIYKFKQGKNELVWKTSKSVETDVELNITGTIKSHKEFRGIRQTELTRCKTSAVVA